MTETLVTMFLWGKLNIKARLGFDFCALTHSTFSNEKIQQNRKIAILKRFLRSEKAWKRISQTRFYHLNILFPFTQNLLSDWKNSCNFSPKRIFSRGNTKTALQKKKKRQDKRFKAKVCMKCWLLKQNSRFILLETKRRFLNSFNKYSKWQIEFWCENLWSSEVRTTF